MSVTDEYRREHGLTPETIADTVLGFYARVGERISAIEASLKAKGIELRCQKGCCGCCRDGLSMSEAEASVIRQLYPDVGKLEAHAVGSCPFLDAMGSCRIYEARPYICRTHGLPLRWFEEVEGDVDEDEVEVRDICELNASVVDVVDLLAEDCWTMGLPETQLALMNICAFGKDEVRIPMRSFFEN